MENFIFLDAVPSTNDHAKALARKGAPHGTAVVAKSQSAGRGRMGRSFLSPEGGLYLSVILRPQVQAAELSALTPVLAVAACDAIEKICNLRPGIKWCNDLLLGGKKLAGILTEPCLRPDGTVDFAVCGIGLNCAAVPEDVADIATCLPQMPDIPLLAEAIRDAWTEISATLTDPGHMVRYRAGCVTIGKPVLVCAEAPWEGFAADVADDGALLVEKDGETRRIFTGEVSVRNL